MCSIIDDNIKIVDDFDEQSVDNVTYADLSRRDLRSLIFHLLYAAESHDYQESVEAIADNLSKGFTLVIEPDSEVIIIARQVIDLRDSLDEAYKPLLTNWRFDRISVSIKLILRLAVWELLHTDMDQRIVINEAIELAKAFAEEDAFRFINGILDGIAHQETKSEL
ncbi:MAG: transcription antitermination factor NusB [Candidatus Dependentiae bacterium]|nr:transcription antitermination factor NusB [Candidatus Dependentiae bacterium]